MSWAYELTSDRLNGIIYHGIDHSVYTIALARLSACL